MIGVELANMVAVQCPQDADTRHHDRTPVRRPRAEPRSRFAIPRTAVRPWAASGYICRRPREGQAGDRAGLSYLIIAKHSFRRSSSKRTCDSMASCNASVPLLDNSAEAFLSRFCFQSRIACLVALWASDVALRYAFMQASAIEQVLHSWAATAFETSKIRVAATTFIVFPRYWPPADVLLG